MGVVRERTTPLPQGQIGKNLDGYALSNFAALCALPIPQAIQICPIPPSTLISTPVM